MEIKFDSQEFGGCPLYAHPEDAGDDHWYFIQGAESNCDYIMESVSFSVSCIQQVNFPFIRPGSNSEYKVCA